jgi:hypothetical protein
LDGLLVAVYRSSLIADLIMDIPQGIHDIAFGPRVSQRLSNREGSVAKLLFREF